MAHTENLPIEILKEIRDEIRSTREGLRDELRATRVELSAGIDQTKERLDETNGRLGTVENTLLDLATQQRFLVRNAKRSAAHEQAVIRDIDELKDRVSAIEQRLPPKPA